MEETKRICKSFGCICTNAAILVNQGFEDEGYVCHDCLSSGYFKCSHCGGYYHEHYLTELTAQLKRLYSIEQNNDDVLENIKYLL